MLIQSMNINGEKREHVASVPLCFVAMATQADKSLAHTCPHGEWRASEAGDSLTYWTDDLDTLGWRERVALIESLREGLCTHATSIELVRWIFSGVEWVPRSGSGATSHPMLLDLVAMNTDVVDAHGRKGITTKGLAVLIGHEIEAFYGDHDALTLVETLIRTGNYALANGPIDVDEVIGPEGVRFSAELLLCGRLSNQTALHIG